MATYRDQQFCLLFVLLLIFSPQINARHASFFSRFMHLSNNVDVKETKQSISNAPGLASALAPEPVEITPATTPAPSPAPEVAVRGEAYGLYGRDDSNRFSETQEKPAVNNQLLDEELFDESYKNTGSSKTNLYSNYDSNPTNYNNYNSYQYRRVDDTNRNSDNNGYLNNKRSYSYPKVYYNNEFYNNRVDNSNGGDEVSERQGMSDTRFLENGKYYDDVKGEKISNDDVFDESLEKESTKLGEGYYENNKSPYEFDSMEEYERQEESQGYRPWDTWTVFFMQLKHEQA